MRLDVLRSASAPLPEIRPLQYVKFDAPSSGGFTPIRIDPNSLVNFGAGLGEAIREDSPEAKAQKEAGAKRQALKDTSLSLDVQAKQGSLAGVKLNQEKEDAAKARLESVRAGLIPTDTPGVMKTQGGQLVREDPQTGSLSLYDPPTAKTQEHKVVTTDEGVLDVTYDASGKPILQTIGKAPSSNKPLHQTSVELADGKYIISTDDQGNVVNRTKLGEGTKGAAGKPLTATAVANISGKAELARMAKIASEKAQELSDSDVGPFDSRINNFTGGNKKFNEAMQAYNATKNQILKLRSGGAVTPQESERMLLEIGDPTQFSEQKFKDNLAAFAGAQHTAVDNELTNLNEQGYKVPENLSRTISSTPMNVAAKDSGKVMVISPQGVRGSIPASQLQEALQSGYKEAQ